MNQQPKYVKGRDGKFKGSIGSGKRNVPTVRPTKPAFTPVEQSKPVVSRLERWKEAETTTDVGVLEGLANDPDKGVRRRVAGNPACPPEVLKRLASDSNPSVAAAAVKAANPAPSQPAGLSTVRVPAPVFDDVSVHRPAAPDEEASYPSHDVSLWGVDTEQFTQAGTVREAAGMLGFRGSNFTTQVEQTVTQLIKAAGDPHSRVTIFRAVPVDEEKDGFKSGDWVSLSHSYVDEHGSRWLGGKYVVLSMTVPASDLWTEGNSIFEWGYSPPAR